MFPMENTKKGTKWGVLKKKKTESLEEEISSG